MEGDIDANGQQIQIKNWWVCNKAMRTQYTLMGMTGYSIVTKDSGWNYNPFNGQKQAEPMTADMVKTLQVELDIQSPLLDYKTKGYKLAYKGKDDMDGSDVYKLELVVNDSEIITYFIDPASYFILRQKTKSKVNGKEENAQEDFSNYQKSPDGYVFPMNVNSEGGEVKFTVIKVNTDIDSGLFKPKN
jgi:outer membrane lipoprotein-sorting protein